MLLLINIYLEILEMSIYFMVLESLNWNPYRPVRYSSSEPEISFPWMVQMKFMSKCYLYLASVVKISKEGI